jgi:hypothetical protein
MHENENPITAAPKRVPWNKGKLIGPRPPLRQKHVWAIRWLLRLLTAAHWHEAAVPARPHDVRHCGQLGHSAVGVERLRLTLNRRCSLNRSRR